MIIETAFAAGFAALLWMVYESIRLAIELWTAKDSVYD